MKKFVLFIFIVELWWLWGAVRPALAEETVPRFEVEPCAFALPLGETVECGFLVVPEARGRPESGTLRIHVTIIKSRHPEPAPDPVIYLNGGPGGRTEQIIKALPHYEFLRGRRDLILFDQRGVGWSRPNLDCPEVTEVFLQQMTGQQPSLVEQLAPRLACRDRWLAQGINLAAYNSTETAADVRDLWRTLGYRQVNLFGISYGTYVAQILMGDEGAQDEIRSVVLDSPLPLGVSASAVAPAHISASLDHLFEECLADLLCRLAYPDLPQVYSQVLDRLATDPPVLEAVDPLSGRPFNFLLDSELLGDKIILDSYRTLPGLFYDIHEDQYDSLIEAWEAKIQDIEAHRHWGGAGHSLGTRMAIRCSEPPYLVSPAEQARLEQRYPKALVTQDPIEMALCEQWPVASPSPAEAVSSDIPTLILAGEYDLRLPPAFIKRTVAVSLSHNFFLRVPGAPHAVTMAGLTCPQLITRAFLNDPIRLPETGCLAESGTPAFDSRFIIRGGAVRQPVQWALGLFGLLGVGLVMGSLRRWSATSRRFAFTWGHSLKFTGWQSLALSAGLLALLGYASRSHWLAVPPVQIVALVLPIIVALQAAFLLSPEDEPAFEGVLATPRPLAWLLGERLIVLFMLQGGVALATNLALAGVTGEALITSLQRWLPLFLLLSGLAIYLTLATRRAVFGALAAGLVWLVMALFGDFMVARWPVSWPVQLYLATDHPDYLLNRWLLVLIGLSLIGLAALRFLDNEEWLLLGQPQTSRGSKPLAALASPTAPVVGIEMSGFLALAQLRAILRYEFLMYLRQVALPVIVMGLLTTPVLGALIARNDFQGYRAALASGTLSLTEAKTDITAAMISTTWLGIVLIALLLLPPVAGEAGSRERQVGVMELWATLPLSPGVYLAGKLAGLWLGLLLGLGLAALVSSGVWYLLAGPFHLGLYLEVWLIGGGGLLLLQAGLSLLLAAGQPSTRRGILVGGGYALLSLAGLGFLLTPGELWRWLNPARPDILLYYMLGYPGALEGAMTLPPEVGHYLQALAGRRDVFISLAVGLAQVGLLWFIRSQWLARRIYD